MGIIAESRAMLAESRRMMAEAKALTARSNKLLDDVEKMVKEYKDGVAIQLKILGKVLPAELLINPEYSEFPEKQSRFVDGPYDGRTYVVTDEQMRRKSIVLKGNVLYVWDGYVYRYDGSAEEAGVL